MRLIISVDVEEEGLFSGEYARVPPGVENVRQLRRLEFITKEFGFPLTLMVAYQVAENPACRAVLSSWKDGFGAEIGAHLHHWNTPPFQVLPYPEPVRADFMPLPLLEAKFAVLAESLKTRFGAPPSSFRMGRFDLGRQVQQLLPEFGIVADSSVVPLRYTAEGTDHFMAPFDPYFMESGAHGGHPILEVPLTMVPLIPHTRDMIYAGVSRLPGRLRSFLLTAYRYTAVTGIQPAWFSLGAMKRAVRLHHKRGGSVLSMFLHSSELQPGATPDFKTEEAVCKLTARIRAFLDWLVETGPVDGMTLSDLHAHMTGEGRFPTKWTSFGTAGKP